MITPSTRIAKLKDLTPGSLWRLTGKEPYSELVWSKEFKEKCWVKECLLLNECFMVIKLFKKQGIIQVLTPRTTGYIQLSNARKHMVKIEPKDTGATEP